VERKTIGTGILLTPSQKERLQQLATVTGRKQNAVIGLLIDNAELKVVKRVEPVTALAVNEKNMSVTVESGTHVLIPSN
jgi:hypothetical protein